jgi:hypothetical protein
MTSAFLVAFIGELQRRLVQLDPPLADEWRTYTAGGEL